jgi:hypothetical protein
MKEIAQSLTGADTTFLKFDPEANVLCIDDSYIFLTKNMISYLRSVCNDAEKHLTQESAS